MFTDDSDIVHRFDGLIYFFASRLSRAPSCIPTSRLAYRSGRANDDLADDRVRAAIRAAFGWARSHELLAIDADMNCPGELSHQKKARCCRTKVVDGDGPQEVRRAITCEKWGNFRRSKSEGNPTNRPTPNKRIAASDRFAARDGCPPLLTGHVVRRHELLKHRRPE
jgi:hypothetical protein